MRCVALLLLLVSSACAGHQGGPNPLAREQNPPSPLHVVTVGSGRVTTVVLHGGPNARHNYLRPEWDQLQDLGRVVYYDQRGCGKSMREGPHSWTQHVQDLDNLLARLDPEGPVVLAGSSWGSWLALLYAYKHPDKVSALVLSGLVEFWPGGVRREWMDQIPATERAELEALESGPLSSSEVWDSVTVANNMATTDRRLAARLGELCSGNAGALDYSLRTAPTFKDLRNIRVPALVIRGAKPGALKDGAAMFAGVLPNAEMVTIDAAHDPWFEQPDEFFAAVRGFLQARGLK